MNIPFILWSLLISTMICANDPLKIAIVGSPGSGKSTLGLTLHEMVGIPLYHLDQYYWKPEWQRPDYAEFVEIHNQLCDKPEWIIEGCYVNSLFEYRAQQANILIFLDMPYYLCFFRIFKRAFKYLGKQHFANAKGCCGGWPDWTLLKYAWYFNRERKQKIEQIIQKYKNQKKTFIIRNNNELRELIKKFEPNKQRFFLRRAD